MAQHRWQKGQSGNPGGRPRGAAGVSKEIMSRTNNLRDVIDFAIKLLADDRNSTTDRKWAAEYLTERGIGKAQQFITLDGDLVAQLDALAPMTDEQLAEAEERIVEHEQRREAIH